MVKKAISILNTEIRGLHKAAYFLGAAALASQLLALVRERLLASTFGAGIDLDVYFAAFRVPDMVFIIAASIVSLSALVPAIAGAMQVSEEKTKNLINTLFTFFSILIVLLSALAYILIPVLAPILFAGFDPDTLAEQYVPLARLMLLSPFFLGISNLFASITQIHSKFALYAASPILYNIGIIVGITLIYPYLGFIGLGAGVVLGAFAHMAVQLPFIMRSRMSPSITRHLDMQALRSVVMISVPRAVALASTQVSILALIMLGSAMTAGAISIFTLSYTLQSVPLSIIGVSYSVAAFPTLSKLFAAGMQDQFMQKISASLRHIIFWSLPAMVLFVVLRAQIVRVIFGAGEFNWTATRLTAASLALFSIAILAESATLLFIRGYYAAGRTRTPLYISLFGSAVVVVSALIMTNFLASTTTFHRFITYALRVADVHGAEVLALPLSFVLGSMAGAFALWKMFERDFGRLQGRVGLTLMQSGVSALCMGAVAFALLNITDNWVSLESALGVLAQGSIAGLGGTVVGVALLKLMRSRELAELHNAFRGKLWRTRAILPGEEDRAEGL